MPTIFLLVCLGFTAILKGSHIHNYPLFDWAVSAPKCSSWSSNWHPHYNFCRKPIKLSCCNRWNQFICPSPQTIHPFHMYPLTPPSKQTATLKTKRNPFLNPEPFFHLIHMFFDPFGFFKEILSPTIHYQVYHTISKSNLPLSSPLDFFNYLLSSTLHPHHVTRKLKSHPL